MRLGVAAALVDGRLLPGDVEVVDGLIAGVGLGGGGGRGLAVPGFIDLQVNGFGGVDFLDADADGYRRAGAALLEMRRHRVPADADHEPRGPGAGRDARGAGRRARPRILGMHLEGPFLSPTRLGTHRPPLGATPTRRCSNASSTPARCG